MKTQHVSLAENKGEVFRTFDRTEALKWADAQGRRLNRKVTYSTAYYRAPSGKYFVEYVVVSRKVKANSEDFAQPTLAQPIRFGIRPHDRFVEGNKRNK
jgi:hypothetical protein